jgi:hypothetical protein
MTDEIMTIDGEIVADMGAGFIMVALDEDLRFEKWPGCDVGVDMSVQLALQLELIPGDQVRVRGSVRTEWWHPYSHDRLVTLPTEFKPPTYEPVYAGEPRLMLHVDAETVEVLHRCDRG